MNPVKFFRIVVRTSLFVVGTTAFWLGFELDCFLHRKRRRLDIINRWVPRWSRWSLWLYGVHVHAEGKYADDGELYPGEGPNGVGRIFVMNHGSGLDIPILFTVVEAHVISRHDLADWPLIGRSARRVGTLFVDRDSQRSGASVLKEVARSLAAGEAVAMFPEGTSHKGDVVHELKPGAFNAARRAEAEIVPLGVAYGDEAAYYFREPFLRHAKRIASLKRLDVSVEVGEPIAYDDAEPVETIELARQCIQELVDRARARLEELSRV